MPFVSNESVDVVAAFITSCPAALSDSVGGTPNGSPSDHAVAFVSTVVL